MKRRVFNLKKKNGNGVTAVIAVDQVLAIAFGFGDFSADGGIVVGWAGYVDGIVASAWRGHWDHGRFRVGRKSHHIADWTDAADAAAGHCGVVAGATSKVGWQLWVGVAVRGVGVVFHVTIGRIVVFGTIKRGGAVHPHGEAVALYWTRLKWTNEINQSKNNPQNPSRILQKLHEIFKNLRNIL